MIKFVRLDSTVIPLGMDNVDTDLIIPAQFLTKTAKDGYGQYLFQRLKEQYPDFVLNNPVYKQSEILLSKANFGCGSSREHAVWALLQAGIKVVIAESFSDIFYNNAAKNGLLAITLSKECISQLLDGCKKNIFRLIIDLQDKTVQLNSGKKISFSYNNFRQQCLLNGQDDLDYLLEAVSG